MGVKELGTFAGKNVGRKGLEDAGVVVTLVEGLQDRILEVAMAGHEKRNASVLTGKSQ